MADEDAELVQRVLDGERTAYEALVVRHLSRARAIARSVLGDDPAVDDVIQEAFWSAWRHLGQLTDHATFPSWFARIVRNQAISWIRKARRRPTVSIDAMGTQPDIDTAADQEAADDEQVRLDREVRYLTQAMAGLRAAYREILELKYDAKLSYEQIAETLGTSQANVEKKLYRARQALAKAMDALRDQDASPP